MPEPVDIISLTSNYTIELDPDPTESDSPGSDGSSSRFLASSFKNTLSDKLHQVEQQHRTAQNKIRNFAAGKIDNVHEVTVAMQKSRMSLGLATLVRSKFLEAWQQLQNMQ